MNTDTPPRPIFRRMQPGDSDSVLNLGKRGLSYVDLATAEPDPHDYVSLYIMSGLTYKEFAPLDPGNPRSMSFVAEIGDTVVGFLLAYTHLVGIPTTRICVIHAIVVDHEYHGQGIGTQLLSQLQRSCKEEDIRIIRIFIPQHNKQLKNYMGAMGFHQSNVIIFDQFNGGKD